MWLAAAQPLHQGRACVCTPDLTCPEVFELAVDRLPACPAPPFLSFGIDNIDLWSLDVEGGELEVCHRLRTGDTLRTAPVTSRFP